MGEQREPDRAREALHNTGSEWSHRERKEDEREGEVGRIERREGMDREKEKKADEEKKRRKSKSTPDPPNPNLASRRHLDPTSSASLT